MQEQEGRAGGCKLATATFPSVPGVQLASLAASSASSGGPHTSRGGLNSGDPAALVVCTHYECHLHINPPMLAAIEDLQLRSTAEANVAVAEAGFAAASSMQEYSVRAVPGLRPQLTPTPSHAQQQGYSLKMETAATSAETSATVPSEHGHQAEEAGAERAARATSSLLHAGASEGMHAVGGEPDPSKRPDAFHERLPPTPARGGIAVPLKSQAAPPPQSASFKCWKAVMRGSRHDVHGHSSKGGDQACAGTAAGADKREATMRAVQRRLSSFKAEEVFLGQFVLSGRSHRCCGGALQLHLCMPAMHSLCCCSCVLLFRLFDPHSVLRVAAVRQSWWAAQVTECRPWSETRDHACTSALAAERSGCASAAALLRDRSESSQRHCTVYTHGCTELVGLNGAVMFVSSGTPDRTCHTELE